VPQKTVIKQHRSAANIVERQCRNHAAKIVASVFDLDFARKS
jgi:hypothetical protein